ncbi:MAG TPA: 50S ribosomal protein L28 [Thermomicrobiales bacterium]|nr:50S ribosomal protein L28 [Thermomicrobiales bacterium]
MPCKEARNDENLRRCPHFRGYGRLSGRASTVQARSCRLTHRDLHSRCERSIVQVHESGRILDVAGKCEVCGKSTTFGHNVSFSKRRTNRMFKPNIQSRVLVINGVAKRRNVCTGCLRTMVKTS